MHEIGDVIDVKVKIVNIDSSDGTYECSHLTGNKETDTMYFDDGDITNDIGLEDALRVIKEECENHISCEYCPLKTYSSKVCGVIQNRPEEWKFKTDESEKVPRIFV